MQLPNKLYSYKNSTLALIPKVLSEIKDDPVPVFELYDILKPELNDATDFLSVMDCACMLCVRQTLMTKVRCLYACRDVFAGIYRAG